MPKTLGPNSRYRKMYYVWRSMQQRCDNPNFHAYEHYGGRGITVCERWRKFEHFLADMGEKQEGMTLDRIDNNGNYEPGNCRWATYSEQMNNQRSNRVIEWNGKKQTLFQWAREVGLNWNTLRHRLEKGLPLEQALNPAVSEVKSRAAKASNASRKAKTEYAA